MTAAVPGPSREGVGAMFDRIAPRYDFLNRVLSMGMDVGWRRAVRRALPEGAPLRVLDVATGTADLLLELAREPRVTELLGVDISEEMLAVGRTKLDRLPEGTSGELRTGDALDLAAYRGQFDAVSIAFGIRNVLDVDKALREMTGTLRPGGRVLVLEFSEPEGPLFAPLYRTYRKHLLPRVGGLVSGDTDAYRYLDETIASFPSGEAFLDKMRAAGLIDVEQQPLAFGAVSLYLGTQPASEEPAA
jgi:demethylmenaquinone methyltransferase/2-methoxy-6-polyprenyl-1,4-benzoquinol methylase